MISCLRHNAPGDGGDRVLLVMLPGAGIAPGEFAEQGMVAAVHERISAADIVVASPTLEHYLDGTVAGALHQSVLELMQGKDYKRLWFLGISLGGMGALLYTSAYPTELDGVILLAPFLGTRGSVAELAEAGGLAAWSPEASAATPAEREMLIWLQDFVARRPARPMLYLGYGKGDRFAPAHRMLAGQLPKDHVVTAEGGHDWKTWRALWRHVLEAAPFTIGIADGH